MTQLSDDLSSYPVNDCTHYENINLNKHPADAHHSTAKLQCHALEFDEETEEDWQYMGHEEYEESVGDNISAIDNLQPEEEAEEEWLSMRSGPTSCNATTTDKRLRILSMKITNVNTERALSSRQHTSHVANVCTWLQAKH